MGRGRSEKDAGDMGQDGGQLGSGQKGKGSRFMGNGGREPRESSGHSESGYDEAYPVLGEGLKLHADLRQYFQEIAPLVGPNGTIKDPEELAMLCNNGLEEAQGSEAALACDASCGRTLEALLTSAELPSLLAFLQGLSGEHFEAVARHHSGSHIIETALQALKQHGDREASEQALSTVCKAASASAVDLLCDRYGSHVLRRILSTLSGRDVQPGQSKHLGQGHRAPGGRHPGGEPVAPPFPALLAQFAEGIAAAAGQHVKQLRLDSSAGPGLQAILLALEGQDVPLLRLVRAFLGATDDVSAPSSGEALASVDSDEVAELMRERSGSHLVEVIVKVAPPTLQAEIFDRFFRGNLRELALHPSANFVLQAMLAAAHSPDQVKAAAQELEDHFPQLLRENRGGVIAALVAACGRLGTYQKEVCRALARALTAQSSSPTRVVPDLLALDQHIASGNRWGKLPPLSCAILVTMFGFPKGSCQPFVDSMGSLTVAECAALAADPGGSRVVEAFLTGPAGDKQKRLLVGRLRGHFAELARDPSGSHCVEKCFAEADIKVKETIVGELAEGEAAILRTTHGPHILRKASVSLYKSSPASWRAHVSASEGARQMFADLFSERPSKKAPKKEPYGGTAEPQKRPNMEDPNKAGKDSNERDNDEAEEPSTMERKERKRKRKKQAESGALEDVRDGVRASGEVSGGDEEGVQEDNSNKKKGKKTKRDRGLESGGAEERADSILLANKDTAAKKKKSKKRRQISD